MGSYLCIFSQQPNKNGPTEAEIISDVEIDLADEVQADDAGEAAAQFAADDAMACSDFATHTWVVVSELDCSQPGPWELYKVHVRLEATASRVVANG